MNKNEMVVVGIGSSAGGLEALQIFLSKLEDISNCAYIIAQHLSPTHKSMMVELLNRVTNIPVIEIQSGMVIKSKTIYMTPENTDIYISKGKLYLKAIETTYGPKPSVNYFFNSLAQEYGSKSIGIILSGTGSDGAFGIRAIKAAGGITLTQSPSTAKYDGMPISAINTGKVDIVAPIDLMSEEIRRIVDNLGKNVGDTINERSLQQIYRLIFDEKGVDFSQYKRNTLIRRIERRMAALKVDTLSDYLDTLRGDVLEVTNLYHDVLIGVTEFFRDKEVFDTLIPYLTEIIHKKEQGEEIRFWSIGCSTGEEAYSLAIILSEILKDKINRYKIKIFATDIDDEALKIARAGVYSETSFINVDKTLLQRYFSIQKNQFEVKKTLRELVVFSRHNIISDSPFLRLDLISCRNMLIYFNQTLQNRFFPIVHYSLKDQALLLLGKSESVGTNQELFITLDKNEKIFKSQYTGIKEPPKLYNYASTYRGYDEPKHSSFRNEEEMLEEKVIEAMQSYLLNQCVLINSSNEIVYVKGEIPYLVHSQGRATNNIFKSVRDELVLDLRSAINEATKNAEIRFTPFRSISLFEDIFRFVRIAVIPIKNDKNDEAFLALFFQSEKVENIQGYINDSATADEAVVKLTTELAQTKSHLQNVIEELETSYEEMQSLNEELSSSNEELQSSNEELETTNEELQSTNEELQTAYSELKVLYDDKEHRTKQLEDTTHKLITQSEILRKQKEITEGIINTTPTAITMVDADGLLTFANTNALSLFKLSKSEILNRSYDASNWVITTADGSVFPPEQLPFARIKRTFESVHSIVHALQTGDDHRIIVSISGAPLFDAQGAFIGAVFSIQDITTLRAMQDSIKAYEAKEVYNYNVLDEKLNRTIDKLQSANSFERYEEEFSLLHLAMQDISSQWRSQLADILVLSKAIEANGDSTLQNLTQSIHDTASTMAKDLEKHRLYYSESFYTKTESFNKQIDDLVELFSDALSEHDVQIDLNLDPLLDIECVPRVSKMNLMGIIERFGSIKNRYISEEHSILEITNRLSEDNKSLEYRFCINYPSNADTIPECNWDFLENYLQSQCSGELEINVESNRYSITLKFSSNGVIVS